MICDRCHQEYDDSEHKLHAICYGKPDFTFDKMRLLAEFEERMEKNG